jgi:hypothetical protein
MALNVGLDASFDKTLELKRTGEKEGRINSTGAYRRNHELMFRSHNTGNRYAFTAPRKGATQGDKLYRYKQKLGSSASPATIFSQLNPSIHMPRHTASSGNAMNELSKDWKERVVAYSKALSQAFVWGD